MLIGAIPARVPQLPADLKRDDGFSRTDAVLRPGVMITKTGICAAGNALHSIVDLAVGQKGPGWPVPQKRARIAGSCVAASLLWMRNVVRIVVPARVTRACAPQPRVTYQDRRDVAAGTKVKAIGS